MAAEAFELVAAITQVVRFFQFMVFGELRHAGVACYCVVAAEYLFVLESYFGVIGQLQTYQELTLLKSRDVQFSSL